jgi:sugar/nucleoside kinase (ribokinase family)
MTQKSTTKKNAIRPIVVGTGLVALDEVISADKSNPVRYWAGGTCGNVLVALSYLGWTAQPVARLANDNATELLLEDLRRWRVSERFVRREQDGSTPIIVQRIRKDASGRPTHSFSWRCGVCGNRFPGYKPELVTVAEEIAPELKDASVFFFDRVSPGALVLAKAAAKSGVLVVFEPSGIGNPILFRQAWEIAHVVKYSHERLSDFPEMDVENNPRLIIETLADAGLRYRWRKAGTQLGAWVESEALPVDDLQDAAGSGDWCTAGILSQVATKRYAGFSRATDETIAKAIRYGQALAAWNCRFEGARGGMYSVTKQQFHSQVNEIMAGTRNVLPVTAGSSIDSSTSSIVCRICDSASHERRGRKKAD